MTTATRLHPRAPFSLRMMRRRMAFAKATEYYLLPDGSLYMTVGDTDGFHVAHVRQPPADPGDPVLEVTFIESTAGGEGGRTAPRRDVRRPEPEERDVPLAAVRHALAVDWNLGPFYERMAADPRTKAMVERFAGLRPVLAPTLFESIIKTIIGQQLNMAFAGTLTRRLIDLCGDSVFVGDARLLVFPSPSAVARLSYETLQARQFSRRKAEYVIDFARLVDSGSFDLAALKRMDDEAVMERMMQVRGLGRWSAECTLMFGLGRPDVWPAADIGLRNAIRRLYDLPEQPSEANVRARGEAWRPYRTAATFYLWETLMDPLPR